MIVSTPGLRVWKKFVARASVSLRMSRGMMNEMHRMFFAHHGIKMNKNGGYYQRGKAYTVDKKLFVAATYLDLREESEREGRGPRPSINYVAAVCGVDWHYVRKVEGELFLQGHIALPADAYKDRGGPSGPGSICMTQEDSFVLYCLYRKQPTRSLKSYANWLFYYNGTVVSESTISRFFIHGFPVRGGFCKANLVPYDKFRPQNIEKAKEYLRILARCDPRRIKYGDEKSIKGRAIHNKKARRDVLRDVVPATLVDPDLRNTYSIIGICGIDKKTTPVRYRITEATVDADLFSLEIEASIASGFLRAGDILVLDNATNHTGKSNTVLENWLWEDYEVFALFLPARTPEWNPIELLWNCLEARLANYDWERVRGPKRVVKATIKVLEGITHAEVSSFYKKSGVFNLHKNNS